MSNDEKTASNALDDLLDDDKTTRAVEQAESNVADVITDFFQKADDAVTETLEGLSRGIAESEEKRKKREGK